MIEKPMIKGAARHLILDTAEQLFADKGVDAVSLRAINAAAGVSAGVLHYHFGNRELLLEALIERHMDTLMKQRRDLLQPLSAHSQPSIDAIIDALLQPLANLLLDGGENGKRYIQFIARLYIDRSEVFDRVSRRHMQKTTAKFPALLEQACPHLSTPEINWRLAAANHAMLQTLADISKPLRDWQQQQPQLETEQILDNLKQFIVGGFSA